MAAQSPRQTSALKEKASEETSAPKETVSTPQHEINKTAVIIGVVGLVALLFMASR